VFLTVTVLGLQKMGFGLIVMKLETRTLHDVVISERGGVDRFPEVVEGMGCSNKVLGRVLFWTTGLHKVVTKQHKPKRPVAC
jgi:hypothetical protein